MTRRQYNYLDHLILTAKKYEIEEYLYYEQKGRKLTAKQIELILLRNGVQIPKDETRRHSRRRSILPSVSFLFTRLCLGLTVAPMGLP